MCKTQLNSQQIETKDRSRSFQKARRRRRGGACAASRWCWCRPWIGFADPRSCSASCLQICISLKHWSTFWSHSDLPQLLTYTDCQLMEQTKSRQMYFMCKIVWSN